MSTSGQRRNLTRQALLNGPVLDPDLTLRELPCLIGDRICLQMALDHPSLDGPVSHLANVALA
jgi:hypothetical protein